MDPFQANLPAHLQAPMAPVPVAPQDVLHAPLPGENLPHVPRRGPPNYPRPPAHVVGVRPPPPHLQAPMGPPGAGVQPGAGAQPGGAGAPLPGAVGK